MEKTNKIIEELNDCLRRDHPNPLYYQLEKKLCALIEHGILLPGERLPGDVELSQMLGIGTITVRKTFARMSQRGLINRIPRAGTFVAEQEEKQLPTIGFFYYLQAETIMVKRAEHIQKYLAKHNYDLKIIGFEKHYFDKENICAEICNKNLCGAIFHTVDTQACKESLRSLEERKFPYVRLGNSHFIGELASPLVVGNLHGRIQKAISHLWEIGHRNIGLISSYKDNETEKQYRSFYSERNVTPRKEWCISVGFYGPAEEWKKFPGPQIARGYLEHSSEVTALLVEHPAVSIDFLKQAILMGKTIPEDISIVSLLDWEGLDATLPSLSAMHLSDGKMAETACNLLFGVISKGFSEESIKKIDFRLITRDSVSPPHKTAETIRG